MAKLTINEPGAALTPSQQIIEDANRIIEETDARGRVFGVRRVTMSLRRRIIKVISDESANKKRYFEMCVVASAVYSIDDEIVKFPQSEIQFDALIDRIGDEGELAIVKAYSQFNSAEGETDEDRAKN